MNLRMNGRLLKRKDFHLLLKNNVKLVMWNKCSENCIFVILEL